MSIPRYLGYHKASQRAVNLLVLDTLGANVFLPAIEGGHFTCFCAMDAEGVPSEEVGVFCSHLLQLGCAYFCAWGPDCERVHDIMDEEVVGENPPASELGNVMTTWHANEGLTEALNFFLQDTHADPAYAPKGCAVALIITVAQTDWTQLIEEYVSGYLSPHRLVE